MLCILILSDVVRFNLNLGIEGGGDNDKVITWGRRLKRRRFFPKNSTNDNYCFLQGTYQSSMDVISTSYRP